MSWADTIEVLRGHLEAAGAAVSPAIATVRMSDSVQTPERQITCGYSGDGPNPFTEQADTLGKRQVGELLSIKGWWPAASFDKGAAEAIDLSMRALKEEIKSRLMGDATLGGTCMGLEVGAAAVAWEQLVAGAQAGQVFRTLTIPITVALTDVSAIAD